MPRIEETQGFQKITPAGTKGSDDHLDQEVHGKLI